MVELKETGSGMSGCLEERYGLRNRCPSLIRFCVSNTIQRFQLIFKNLFASFLSWYNIWYETERPFPSRCRRYKCSPDPGTALRACHGMI
jgi:hypothetical protein